MDNNEVCTIGDTIFPINFYHIKKIKSKYFLYDGDVEVFHIKKFYNMHELIDEILKNEYIKILEKFHTIDGNEYLYVVDIKDFYGDYLVNITKDGV